MAKKAAAQKPAAARTIGTPPPPADAIGPQTPANSLIDEMDEHQTHDMDVHVDAAFHEEYPADWKPPATLDAPPPQAGMAQRWVRISILGQNDPSNVANQTGEGWRPRRLSTVAVGERARYPAQKSQRFGEVIVRGALILCEMPLGIYEQMEAYYTKKRIGQVQALKDDHILRQAAQKGGENKGFGAPQTIESSKKVSRRPPVATD